VQYRNSIRLCLVIAMLLAAIWPSGDSPHVGNEHRSDTVVHGSQQPFDCPCLRADASRLNMTLKSDFAGYLIEPAQLTLVAHRTEAAYHADHFALSRTLQSEFVRLQV
jgi:hypothetical protein